MAKKGRNGKLRAKIGARKWQAERGRLHPVRNEKKALLRAATGERIWLEREWSADPVIRHDGTTRARFEEEDAIVRFSGVKIPEVIDIYYQMKKGAWSP